MNRTAISFLLLGLLTGRTIQAQVPTLESLSIQPAAPTAADAILASVSGTVNLSGAPIIRTETKRVGSDILLDVLIDELPVAAPAQVVPYCRDTSLGILPGGSYKLTARLFWDFRSSVNTSSFPTPWEFPDEYFRGFRRGVSAPDAVLETTFTVVPEPSALILITLAGMATLSTRRVKP